MTTVINGSYPAVNSDSDATINGLTVGKGAFTSNSGAGQVVLGDSAMASNTAGTNNTAIGTTALNANTTAYNNVAVGFQSMYLNTSGTQNTATGFRSLRSNTTGSYNVAFGQTSLYSNTTGGSNTAVGEEALYSNTTASNNAVIGFQSAYWNTTGTGITALGYQAYAQQSTATGNYNTAIGQQALQGNTSASNNTAVGYQAGYSVVSGSYNTFIGNQAGYLAAPTGTALNVAVGHQAGYNLTGTANTLLGNGSGSAITSGAKNSVLGSYSGNQGGLDIRTSSNYIVLSDGDGNPSLYGTGAGFWTLGTGGTSSANTGFLQINGTTAANYGPMLRFSNNGTYLCDTGDYANVVGGSTHQYAVRVGASGGVYLAPTATSWSAVSDENRKNIIEPITNGLNKILSLRTVIGSYKEDKQNIRHPFLIAQDVQKVLPEAVSESEDREGKVLGLSYTEVIPLLVNAIQELKTEFDTYKATHP